MMPSGTDPCSGLYVIRKSYSVLPEKTSDEKANSSQLRGLKTTAFYQKWLVEVFEMEEQA
jgi:hypothetical protein